MGKKKSQNRVNRRHDNSMKNVKNINSLDSDTLGKIIIVCVVVVFLIAFYLLTVFITNKNSTTDDKSEEKSEVSISYDNIAFGRSLSMGGEYYVIYYDGSDDKIKEEYSTLVNDYKAKEDHLKIYYVDMGNGVNSNRSTTDETNKNPSSIDELKINGPTLIKVNDGVVSEYYEGHDSINEHLS